jgi:phage-related protein
MTWTVETLSAAVDAELDALPATIQARLSRIVELIEALGLEKVGEPHVKHLDGKLWEMRPKAQDGIARAIYVTATGRRVVIVHAFVKKTQRTPKTALELARQRAKEVT